MEPIISKSRKVALSERTKMQNVFVNVVAVFKKESLVNEGTDSEEVIGIDHPTEQVQIQFDPENAGEISSVNLAEMLAKAIQQLKDKVA